MGPTMCCVGQALEEGLSCQEVCDKYNAIHRDIYAWFGIACDRFGRTPTWQQTEIAQVGTCLFKLPGCYMLLLRKGGHHVLACQVEGHMPHGGLIMQRHWEEKVWWRQLLCMPLCCWRQDIFAALEDAGQLVEQEGQQLYSEAAGKFLADRFVTGTCPKCGYEVRPLLSPCLSL